MRQRRSTLALVAAASLALPAGLAAIPVAAVPSEDLIISEVYGRGGSANQPYKYKFVEIYNAGDAAVDLTGKSIQYRSPTGTAASSSVQTLEGTVDAGGIFVLKLKGNPGGTGADFDSDQTSTTLNPGDAYVS